MFIPHLGSGFFPTRIPGSRVKKAWIPDLEPQHWFGYRHQEPCAWLVTRWGTWPSGEWPSSACLTGVSFILRFMSMKGRHLCSGEVDLNIRKKIFYQVPVLYLYLIFRSDLSNLRNFYPLLFNNCNRNQICSICWSKLVSFGMKQFYFLFFKG